MKNWFHFHIFGQFHVFILSNISNNNRKHTNLKQDTLEKWKKTTYGKSEINVIRNNDIKIQAYSHVISKYMQFYRKLA